MNGTIYLLTFPNGKGYVGQTINLEQRLRQHRSRNAYAVGKAWAKHGEPEVVVLAEGLETKAELDRAEVLLIAGMGTLSPRGYNLTEGGEGTVGYTVTDETRAKLSAAGKGRPHSPDHARKIGEAHTGMKRSAEARANMSAGQQGNQNSLGAKRTPEQRERYRQAALKREAAKRNNQ